MNIKDKLNKKTLKKILITSGCVAIAAASFMLFKHDEDIGSVEEVYEDNTDFVDTDEYGITAFANNGHVVCTMETQPEAIDECVNVALEMMSKYK